MTTRQPPKPVRLCFFAFASNSCATCRILPAREDAGVTYWDGSNKRPEAIARSLRRNPTPKGGGSLATTANRRRPLHDSLDVLRVPRVVITFGLIVISTAASGQR